jgi:hypothetical protein
MQYFISLIFVLFFSFGYLNAQVPEGQPRQHREQYEELQEQELENEPPVQEPQPLEQEGEVTPPGQDQEDIERSEEFEQEPFQEGGEAAVGRYQDQKIMEYRELPEAVKSDLRNNHFNDWKVQEVYPAEENNNEEELPADYILKVEKEGDTMYLHYQSNGELIMQAVPDI